MTLYYSDFLCFERIKNNTKKYKIDMIPPMILVAISETKIIIRIPTIGIKAVRPIPLIVIIFISVSSCPYINRTISQPIILKRPFIIEYLLTK